MIKVFCNTCKKTKRTRRVGLTSCSRHRENRPRHETNAQCFSRVKIIKTKKKVSKDEIKSKNPKSKR